MKNKLKTHKGITLIALVITIIVLLILSGVAISMISGDNGILKQAARAKETTEDTSILENIQLAELASRMKDGEINFSILKEELNKTFGENGYSINPDNENPENGWEVEVKGVKYGIDIITLEYLKQTQNPVNKNITLKDEDEYSITIPKNFNVAKESPIKVTEGIIIEDREDNQYVWIPIIEKTEETTWGVNWDNLKNVQEGSDDYYNAIKTALKEYTKNYASDKGKDEWYGNEDTRDCYLDESGKPHYYSNGNMTEDQYTKLYNDMLDSVYKNKGFYIGRYEMGIKAVNDIAEAKDTTRTKMSEYKSSTNNETNQAPSLGNMTAPISKANAIPYTYITQSQAQMLAQKLKEKADYSNVTTSIMFGVEWDVACVFIEHFDPNNTAKTNAWVKTDSTAWGNYKISEFTLDRGFYNIYNDTDKTFSGWNEKSSDIVKENGTMWLCTTGASDKNSSLNIYDFAGNLDEFTLEKVIENSSGSPCSLRGYDFNRQDNSFFIMASARNVTATCTYSYYYSSRSHFFIN